MRQLSSIIIGILFITNSLSAQRYAAEIFSEVQVTENVVFGKNATVLYQPEFGVLPENLHCDIYEPLGDDLDVRQLVLVFHTGNFLPPVINGRTIGTKKDSSIVEICTQLAKRGFVAAAVSYRLGWNPLAATQPERATGFIRALYRDIQDGRTAIRYFKMTATEESNPYSIDVDKIACWGVGTGAHIVLGMVGLTDYNELLETDQLLLDLDMDGTRETPMVDTLYLGDPEAKKEALDPEISEFGVREILCYPNHPDYDSDFHVAVNIGGGLVDTSWLDDQHIPIISVQSVNDMFTPYNNPPLIVSNADPVLNILGAQKIGKIQEANGINSMWKDYGYNDPTTDLAIKNSELADHPYYEGTFPYVQEPNSNGLDEGVVIDWWDPDAPAHYPGGMGIPWNRLPHPSGESTYHEQGLILNEGMSAEKAKANIDTVMQYVIPRIMLKMGILEIIQANQQVEDQSMIHVSPNPVTTYLQFHSEGAAIKSIQILNSSGRLVQKYTPNNSNSYMIDQVDLQPGVYFVKINVEDAVVCKKIIVL